MGRPSPKDTRVPKTSNSRRTAASARASARSGAPGTLATARMTSCRRRTEHQAVGAPPRDPRQLSAGRAPRDLQVGGSHAVAAQARPPPGLVARAPAPPAAQNAFATSTETGCPLWNLRAQFPAVLDELAQRAVSRWAVLSNKLDSMTGDST